jgi:hypothetical protein
MCHIAFIKNKKMKNIMILFRTIILLSIFMVIGCGYHKMNLNKGTFQVFTQPTLSGSGKELASNNISKNVQIEYSQGENTTKSIQGYTNKKISNGDTKDLEYSNVVLDYRIIENTFDIQAKAIKKYDYLYIGSGLGFELFPYLWLELGVNTKYFEIGTSTLLGIAYNKASYNGEYVYWGMPGMGLSVGYGDGEVNKNIWDWHSFWSGSLYTSLYVSNVGIKYSGSLSLPMGLFNDLPARNDSYEYDLSFWFPYIIKQSVQIVYSTKWEYEIGVGVAQITGNDFAGRDYVYTIQLGKNCK